MKLCIKVILIAILYFANPIQSDSVCDLATLKREIIEDLADNNQLDCMRVIEPPHNSPETDEAKKNLRIMAQWDSACSFEAKNNWVLQAKNNLGITELVDSTGAVNANGKDFDDQADMCELVRAALARELISIKNIKWENLRTDDFGVDINFENQIQCPGTGKDEAKICAANSSSFFNRGAWTIFMFPTNIKFAGKPSFQKKLQNDFSKPTEIEDGIKEKIQDFITSGAKGFLADIIKNGGKVYKKITGLLDDKKDANGDESYVKTFMIPKDPKNFNVRLDNTERKFRKLNERLLVDVPYIATSISFYMCSYNIARIQEDEILRIRFAHNGNEISDSRRNVGPAFKNSVSSLFIFNMDPDGTQNGFEIDYSSNNPAVIKFGEDQNNLTIATIILHAADIYKYVNIRPIEIEANGSQRFNYIGGDTFLKIKNILAETVNYLVVYNTSVVFPRTDMGSLWGNVLKQEIAGKFTEIPETIRIAGRGRFLSNHAATVVKVNANSEINFTLGYYSTESFTLKNSSIDNSVVSLSAILLSKQTKIHQFFPKKPVSMGTSGTFKSMNFEINLPLTKRTKILVLFNFNLKVNGKNFNIQLRINGKTAERSKMGFNQVEYASGQGYVLELLEPSKGLGYAFDLFFRFDDGKNNLITQKLEADSIDITKETVSMTIIELDDI